MTIWTKEAAGVDNVCESHVIVSDEMMHDKKVYVSRCWVDFELRLKCLIRRVQPLLLLRVEIDHILVNY